MRRQVMCVNRHDHHDPGQRITHIGGQGWRHTADEAIINILSLHADKYFIKPPSPASDEIEVIVRYRQGVSYLTTEVDGESQNNLLSLPQCVALR